MAEMETVEMSDGAKLRVKIHCNVPGRPWLLTHHGGPGASDHTESETSFLHLSDRFRVLVFDARGSGDSDLTPPFTHGRWVADLEELRVWAAAETFILGGGSYGGIIALEYIVKHPARVSALILRDTCAYGPFLKESALQQILSCAEISPDPERQKRIWDGKALDDMDFARGLLEAVPAFPKNVSSIPSEGEVSSIISTMVCHSATHNAAFGTALPVYDLRSKLKSINVPTLVVVGRYDRILPVSCSEEISAGIPGSQLIIFEGSGHSPPAEEPAAFQKCLDTFLAGLKTVKGKTS